LLERCRELTARMEEIKERARDAERNLRREKTS
jgi:hypothetical protein